MNSIEELRDNLTQIDRQLAAMLEKRYAVVDQIMAYKEEHDLPVLCPKQEERTRELLTDDLEGTTHTKEIFDVYDRIVKNSKKMQARYYFNYNIFLIGFMGVGKTTISDYISDLFAMKIIEMDQEIAERQGMSIPDIFEIYGEEYFRKLETELLIDMQSQKNVIISCGGGVPMRECNVAEMKKRGRVVLLTATPQTILDRIREDDDRPLLRGNKNVEYIEKLMNKRKEKYEAAADIIICTDHKSVLEICEELVERLLIEEQNVVK